MHYYVTPEIAQEFERCLAKRGLGAEAACQQADGCGRHARALDNDI